MKKVSLVLICICLIGCSAFSRWPYYNNAIPTPSDNSNLPVCHICHGTGKVDCSYCDGSGRLSCGACDGSGNGSMCYSCSGSGRVFVPVIGWQKCGNCNGRGYFKCVSCNGSGTVKCSFCNGTGKIECRRCHGTGKSY